MFLAAVSIVPSCKCIIYRTRYVGIKTEGKDPKQAAQPKVLKAETVGEKIQRSRERNFPWKKRRFVVSRIDRK
jgi:hypothetical protein